MGSARSTVSRGERLRSAEEGQRAAQCFRVEGAALEDELEHRPTSQENAPVAAESAIIEAIAAASSPRCGAHRREKTPVFLHARLVARGFS